MLGYWAGFQGLQRDEVMLGTLKNSLIRTQIVLEIDNKKCLESPRMFWIFQNSVNVKTRSQKVLYLYIKMCLVLGSVKIIRQVFHLQKFPVGMTFKSHKGCGTIFLFLGEGSVPGSCPSNTNHWGNQIFSHVSPKHSGGYYPLCYA